MSKPSKSIAENASAESDGYYCFVGLIALTVATVSSTAIAICLALLT